MNSSAKRIFKAWIPSAICLAVIAMESTDLGSSYYTAKILYPLFHFVFNMGPGSFALWHMLLRKTGHFVGYFTVSVFLFRSWRATFPRLSTRWCLQWATVALFSTALVAALDEWHQTFLPSRTGTLLDVLLDTAAALVAQITIYVIVRIARDAINRSRAATGFP